MLSTDFDLDVSDFSITSDIFTDSDFFSEIYSEIIFSKTFSDFFEFVSDYFSITSDFFPCVELLFYGDEVIT